MIVEKTSLPGVLLIKPKVFGDHRGFFFESYQEDRYKSLGIETKFVQDNISKSSKGILRGLHFQNPQSQGKLIGAVVGSIFDVAVDVRYGSPTFGKWYGAILSDENKHQLFIPRGYAHGFVVTSETAICQYKCDEYYRPEMEASLLWNDSDIKIDWPIGDPILSQKDAAGRKLCSFTSSELPKP